MPNGAAAQLPRTLEPPPATAPNSTEVEVTIGELLTAIADLSVRALVEHQKDGRLTSATKSQGGALVAQLYELRQVLGGADFACTMRRQAQLRLRWRHGVALSGNRGCSRRRGAYHRGSGGCGHAGGGTLKAAARPPFCFGPE
jgi:hypothetical protein